MRVRVAIIGSGFSGLAAAYRLKKAGVSFVVLEKGDDLGGTWRDNTYPGLVCDVPSNLYSFSWAPNPSWSRNFAPQQEILDYLRATAQRFGLLSAVRLRTPALRSTWDGAAQCWRIDTGDDEVLADVLVVAAGFLSEPRTPDIPGIDSFVGTMFHSARWRHDHRLEGERVASIGTGASAVQFIPHVQQRAEHLTVFQRTPAWVLPRADRALTPLERRLYRAMPWTQAAVRGGIYAMRESWVTAFGFKPSLMRVAEKRALKFLESEIADSDLRRKLTPSYRLGCKRVLLSNDYYRALAQPNVTLETDRIVRATPAGLVTIDAAGREREHRVDTIILGTGFAVTKPPIADSIVGRNGRTLAEQWLGGMAALRGTTVAGFPNMFLMVGPNTGLGHSSIVLISEAQAGYVVDALATMARHGVAAIEPKQHVQDAYNDELQRKLARTVWNTGGCASWYLDERGRNTTLWPTFTFSFRRHVDHFDPREYVAERRRAASPVAVR